MIAFEERFVLYKASQHYSVAQAVHEKFWNATVLSTELYVHRVKWRRLRNILNTLLVIDTHIPMLTNVHVAQLHRLDGCRQATNLTRQLWITIRGDTDPLHIGLYGSTGKRVQLDRRLTCTPEALLLQHRRQDHHVRRRILSSQSKTRWHKKLKENWKMDTIVVMNTFLPNIQKMCKRWVYSSHGVSSDPIV